MITLQNECLQVEISEVGGQITSIKDKKDQTEFLWSGDPTYWKGQAP
ncbi:MAG: aldose 1-epimerase family protein, partial [Lachnospiraceae bacterium]|nr:aldose 1-epimerase family protein [Lachnospiraceae bacterium]